MAVGPRELGFPGLGVWKGNDPSTATILVTGADGYGADGYGADERGKRGSRLGEQSGEPRLLEPPPDAVWAMSRRPMPRPAADPVCDDVFGLSTNSCAPSGGSLRPGIDETVGTAVNGAFVIDATSLQVSADDLNACIPTSGAFLRLVTPAELRRGGRKALFFPRNQSC